VRRERPRRRAAEQCDERAAVHSITSSAATSSVCGTVRPSMRAVWWLMTSSNLLDCTRQIRRLGALEDAAGIDAGLTIGVGNVASVAHQSADFGKFAPRIDRGQPMVRRLLRELHAPAVEKTISGNEEGLGQLAANVAKAASISRLVLARSI